jgi:hypothetical protein
MPSTERWISAGQRIIAGKLANAWAPDEASLETEDLLCYAVRRGRTYSLGMSYEAQVERSDDRVTLHGTPACTGEKAALPAALLARWAARTEAARARHTAGQAEARAKREGSPIGAMTLEALREELRRLPAPHRRGLLAFTLDYLAGVG